MPLLPSRSLRQVPRVAFNVTTLVVAAALVVACSSSDASAPPNDTPTTDGGPSEEGGDGGTGTPPGQEGPSTCGNAKREGAELCDGDEVACSSLAALYTGGMTKCRPDCGGYDVSTCTVSSTKIEAVQPNVREPATWPHALCNKRGAFPLFVRRSATSKKWVVRLEGGGACAPSGGRPCYVRAESFVAPVLDNGQPIVDRALSDAKEVSNIPASFADPNYALLIYCSSDAWTGTRTEPMMVDDDATGTKKVPYTFTGRYNVRAALEILKQRYGLDDGDAATQIFFQGGSAGGHGVLHNVDQVKKAMPKTAAAKHLWAYSTAATYFAGWKQAASTVPGNWSAIDITGAHTGAFWEDGLPAGFGDWQAQMSDGRCAAAHPGHEELCFFASVHQPYIVDAEPKGLGVPLLVSTNLEDPNPQGDFGLVSGNGANTAFVDGGAAASKKWGDTLAADLANTRWVFAPRDPLGFHGARMTMKGAATPTLQSLVDAFVTKAEPDPFSYIDFPLAGN